VTFWRRLSRDLREHRKPPLVLVRRGYALALDQRRVVSHALKQGCRRATGDQAYAELTAHGRRSPESA
jgi:uridine kinase